MSVLSRVSEKRISRGVVLRFSFLLGPPFRVQASRVESASRRSGWVPGRGHTNLRTRPGFSPWGQRPMEGQTNDEALPQVWRWPEGSWDCLKQIVLQWQPPATRWPCVEEAEGPSAATTPGSAGQLLETERLIRRRPRGPLQPDRSNMEERRRPSLKRALEIASDPTLSQRARLGFDQLVYSAGSNDTKASMFRTWKEVQERSGLPALSLTQSKCETFVAVLRAAGEWWQKLFELEGLKMAEKPLAPFGGILLWALGSHFLLREGELAMLDLHENTVRLDEVAKTITLSLSVSKSDPGGRTARRTLRCCGSEDDTTFHGLLCRSNAIEAYIEDAMEESPDMATILTDHEQVQAALNAFRKDLDELKDQVRETAEAAAERPSSSKAALESLDTEVRRMWDNIRPAYIRNTTTNKVHSTQACLFWEVPSAWATKCGWKWAASSKTVTYVSEDELNQFPLCDKCFA